MVWLRRLVYLLVVIPAAAVGLLFVIENSAPVELRFLLWHSPPLSVGIWLLLALSLGLVFGVTAGSVGRIGRRRKRRPPRRGSSP
ncbi:MAG: lipopolysaccharide assembly protein LapA domain-containing protein [Pseudomonadota bacterium]|nr:lipopolysaccharide assembly protein LapA domain-containing protein [Pseudomonadota bacterium]